MFELLSSLRYRLFSQARPALENMKLRYDDSNENPLMIQFFTWDCLKEDISWWKHFENEIPALAAMGITQVWLPPPNKAAHKTGHGYDAYDLWDLGEFEQKGQVSTRWGTKDELLQACSVAQNHRIGILIDAVLNHKMGADRMEVMPAVPVRDDNRLKAIGKVRDIEGWTAYDFVGRQNKYSHLRWTQEHFTGVDWDQRSKTRQIFRISGGGHKGWSENVDRELGNYDYLLGADIDHRHPAVKEDLLQWGQWVLQTTGAVGFRLDAIKHIDRNFLLDFLSDVRQSTDPKMFAVSEYWSGDVKRALPYIRHFKGQTAFFDVPLHMNFHRASRLGSRFDLRTIMSRTIAKARPGDAVTFVDNHDTVEGQSLESWVGDNFKIQAYALILLRPEGYPCVFYGDLYPDAECYRENVSLSVKLLIEARKMFAYGPIQEYFEDKNCIGFVRLGTGGSPLHNGCAVIISNQEAQPSMDQTLRMNVGKVNGGAIFRSFLSGDGRVAIDSEGWGIFFCLAGMVQVWVKE